MSYILRSSRLPIGVAAIWLALASVATAAPAVYSGFDVSFTKPAYADPTLPENQDLLTANVALTRGSIQGLYNAVQEAGWAGDRSSPADTEWATAWNNDIFETIAASNWSALSYTTWAEAYGGFQNLQYNITQLNAVVHLTTDDVYLDLWFTDWSSGGGGTFTYYRSTLPPPGPATTGDYNGNGVVDAADYTVWRDTLGQSVASPGDGADGNLSGTIDPGDFTFWKEHFGELVPGPGAGAAAAAVPEPAAALLCLLGLALVLRPARPYSAPRSEVAQFC
jgi:hypothetical protein